METDRRTDDRTDGLGATPNAASYGGPHNTLWPSLSSPQASTRNRPIRQSIELCPSASYLMTIMGVKITREKFPTRGVSTSTHEEARRMSQRNANIHAIYDRFT